jgi:fluoride exporter
VVAVGLGGAAGAALRWAVVTTSATGAFPWPVLAVNVAGSVILGLLLAEERVRPRAHVLLHDFGAIGFCGGLTTFSTFSLEVVNLVRQDDVWTAAVYGVVSVAAAVVGVISGPAILGRVSAAGLPLEEVP